MLKKAKYVSRIHAGEIRPLQQQSVSKRVIVFGTYGTGKVVDVMAIKVMYHNDTYGEVDPSLLDDLISKNTIKKFLRAKGWATVGVDPVRQTLRGRIPSRTAEPRRKKEAVLPDRRGAAVPSGDFQPLFESAPALFLVLNPNFQIVAVSDAYLRATMTRRGDILGHDIFEIFPDNPDDLNASGVRNLRTSLLRVLQNRKPDVMPVQKYDIRRSAERGGSFEERYWCPVNAPVLGIDKEVKYLIHRVEDVTKFITFRKKELERHKLTKELRERTDQMEAEIYARTQEVAEMNLHLKEVNAQLQLEHDKLKTLVESVSDEIWFFDKQGNVLYMNPAVARNLGVEPGDESPPEEILASLEVFNPDGSPRRLEETPLYRTTNNGESVCGEEIVHHLKTGEPRYRQYTVAPMRNRDGRIFGAVAVVRDITEQKRLVFELQEALANVQQLSGMLPICASCKKIRDDTGYWTQVETYIHQHSQADFTHSICPECAAKLYPDIFPDDR